MLFSYFSGVVLLFGGWRAWKVQRFPFALLLLVNPVPGLVSTLVDLPLQAFAAQAARYFAHILDLPVTGEALKLMFSPTLGIFLAPGCNGLQGAVAMGYLALILGYLWRMPKFQHGCYIFGAIALAYLFNLLRLAGVVLYYWCAVRIPAINMVDPNFWTII